MAHSVGRIAATLAIASIVPVGQAAVAQEMNIRTTAAPATDATTAQVIAEARLKQMRAQQSANGLLANKVTNGAVSTDCNMQVGGQQTDRQAAPPKSLVGSNGGVSNVQNSTVVLGSTVLLCNKP